MPFLYIGLGGIVVLVGGMLLKDVLSELVKFVFARLTARIKQGR